MDSDIRKAAEEIHSDFRGVIPDRQLGIAIDLAEAVIAKHCVGKDQVRRILEDIIQDAGGCTGEDAANALETAKEALREMR